MTDFVRSHGGHSVISKVRRSPAFPLYVSPPAPLADLLSFRQILIANNGIAAVKEIRSVRKWCYETFGDERAVEFTAMATPEDLFVPVP